jgi:hypothetical protein
MTEDQVFWIPFVEDLAYEISMEYPYEIRHKETKKILLRYILWVTCYAEPQYEVLEGLLPIQIRNKETKKIVKEFYSNGSPSVKLGRKTYSVSHLMALQYISNPDGIKEDEYMKKVRKELKAFLSFHQAIVSEIERLLRR